MELINTSLMNWIINSIWFLRNVEAKSGFLQQEDGFYILQENSDRIIL